MPEKAPHFALLEVDRRAVRAALLTSIVLLTLASLVVQVARDLLGLGGTGFVLLFDAGLEANFPSYFSALTLLACALAFTVIARTDPPERRARWTGLALLTALFSVDEAAGCTSSSGL